MDGQSPKNLVAMYEAAIAELRNLHDPEVDTLIARLQAHQQRLQQLQQRPHAPALPR